MSVDSRIVRSYEEQIERLRHERDTLAKAIGDAAVEIGIIKAGVPLTGPQCIQLVDDIVWWVKRRGTDGDSSDSVPEYPWNDGM